MAKQYLQQMLAIELIAEKEDLELSDKEYDEAITEFAKENGYSDKKALLETWGEDQVKRIHSPESGAGLGSGKLQTGRSKRRRQLFKIEDCMILTNK